MPRHELTDEERERGRETRALRYAEAREEASERLSVMTAAALTRLETLLFSESDGDAYKAVKDVLDRVLGKPGQSVEITGGDGKPVEVKVEHTVVDLARVIGLLGAAGVLGARPAPDTAGDEVHPG